jgi:hypothetical protein
MAKQRPQLGVYASPANNFVAPIDPQKSVSPVDQQAIRNAYEFADSFGQLSVSMARLAGSLKTQQNEEEFAKGRLLVNENRKTYSDLVRNGQINPSENPWLAVGAQTASGVLEATRARNEFKVEYDRQISQNPELLKDNQFFDALASSFADRKRNEIGDSQYLSNSFFEAFNPYMVSLGAEHADKVGKYRQGKIVQSISVKVDEAIQATMAASRQPKGFVEPMYDLGGNQVVSRVEKIDIPSFGKIDAELIVPDLSISAKETLVYNNGSFADLNEDDQAVILEHNARRLAEERDPSFDQISDETLPDLQLYIDEQGANMGMSRVANLAAASSLVEAMKSSPATYEAEKILRGLKGGTGAIADTEEVKAMLMDARPDIEKNRFAILNSREKSAIGMFIEAQGKKAFLSMVEDGQEYPIGAAFDNFDALLDSMTTLTIEDRNKLRDSLIEKINNMGREGRESFDRSTMLILERQAGGLLEEQNVGALPIIYDFGSLKRQHAENMRKRGIDPNGERKAKGFETAHNAINQSLATMESLMIARLNNDPSLGSSQSPIVDLNINKGDDDTMKMSKEKYRRILRTNELLAAIHFDMRDRLQAIRSPLLSGVSVDVERGLTPQMRDLIYLYQDSQSGLFPTTDGVDSFQSLLGTDSRGGERGLKFLQLTTMAMRQGVDINNAARDAAQQVGLTGGMDPLDMVDERLQEELVESAKEGVEDKSQVTFASRWIPFVGGEPINPDARLYATSHMITRFVSNVQSGMDPKEAHKQARASFDAEVGFARGSFYPKSDFPGSTAYFAAAADVAAIEAKVPDAKDPTFVIVGYRGDGKAVYGLRDADGNAISNKYYFAEDLNSQAKPRDELNRVIPGSMSYYEKVIQRMGKMEDAKKQPQRNAAQQRLREIEQRMNSGGYR